MIVNDRLAKDEKDIKIKIKNTGATNRKDRKDETFPFPFMHLADSVIQIDFKKED